MELTQLVGAIPEVCTLGTDALACRWVATGRTYGHGMLARAAGLSLHKKVALECLLPADRGPRADGSCSLGLP